jgi:hypothetical protein
MPLPLAYYYTMPLNKSMPDTIADMMASEDASATKRWMSDDDLNVYVQEWSRTGFQGGLNFYRTTTDPAKTKDMLAKKSSARVPLFLANSTGEITSNQELWKLMLNLVRTFEV